MAWKLGFPVLLKITGTDEEREAADRLKFLLYMQLPRGGVVGDVVLLGGLGVTTLGRIWDGGELGRDAESPERLPSTEGRWGVGESREGRLALSPGEGVVGPCRDVGDLARVGEEGESGRWLVLADPRVVPNRREGGDGDSGTSNRSRCLGVSMESR